MSYDNQALKEVAELLKLSELRFAQTKGDGGSPTS